jgi:hypothetical protein
MKTRRERGTKTETLSLRLDPKTKFILEFVSRINGQTITTIVDRAIRSSCDEVRLPREDYDESSNWKDFWDPHEGVRTLNLLACSTYPTTFDEDELRSFTEAHKEFFYLPDYELRKPNRALLQVLWPKIDEYRQIWRDHMDPDHMDKDYWAAGKAMVTDLVSAKIKPPTWPRVSSGSASQHANRQSRDDFDEIPF